MDVEASHFTSHLTVVEILIQINNRKNKQISALLDPVPEIYR